MVMSRGYFGVPPIALAPPGAQSPLGFNRATSSTIFSIASSVLVLAARLVLHLIAGMIAPYLKAGSSTEVAFAVWSKHSLHWETRDLSSTSARVDCLDPVCFRKTRNRLREGIGNDSPCATTSATVLLV